MKRSLSFGVLKGALVLVAVSLLVSTEAVAQPQSGAWTQVAKLTASPGGTSDVFGISVSLSGDRALVGARLDDGQRFRSGSAYVFEQQSGVWAQVAKLTASDGEGADFFGSSVSLSGDRALVGAPLDDDNGISSGSAYVFELQSGAWTQVAKLTASDGAALDFFGISVSLSGDRALVGARFDDDNGSDSGSAYVFEQQSGVWTQVAKLTASDAATGDEFGYSVSLSGDRALVGAFGDDDNGPNSGSAYVFEIQSGAWTQVAKLTASDGAAFDDFGFSVSLSGDRALVGAFRDADNGFDSGSAYVFELQSGAWTQVAKLTASDGAASDFFGFEVSLSGDRALVGAREDDDGNGLSSGSAYVFERQSGDWTQVAKLTASDGAVDDQFGYSVSLSGDRALVGAYLDDDNKVDSGSAYIFEVVDSEIGGKIAALLNQVGDLVSTGALDPLLGSRMSDLLDRALGAVTNGQNEVAAAHLETFVLEVNRLIKSKKLSAEEGQSLIEAANAIIALLNQDVSEAVLSKASSVSSDENTHDLPQTFSLHQNHPNPFNPSTNIRFTLPETALVRLSVYDMLGREVGRLVDGAREAGSHEVTFTSGDLPSGTYLYRLETPEGALTQRMLLLK